MTWPYHLPRDYLVLEPRYIVIKFPYPKSGKDLMQLGED